jgi:ketosteroid isomerase-like protein
MTTADAPTPHTYAAPAAAENGELLRSIFAALADGDSAPYVAAMAEDFRWEFPGTWSWARDWGSTKQDVRRNMLLPLMEQFASYRARAEEIFAVGDRVIVRARAEASTVRGDDYPQAYCFVYRLRDGRITEVIEYCDTALVERVLEMPAG